MKERFMRISLLAALFAASAVPAIALAQSPAAPAAAPAVAPAAATTAAPAAAPTPAPKAAAAMPAAVNTVAAALKSPDDTKVVLEGQIVRKIDAQHFEFKDATGMVKVGIDKKHAPAKGLDTNAKVRLNGEVDVKKTGVEIEVKKVEVLG
jgi:uncharacterized protein (TIGR00156 family)